MRLFGYILWTAILLSCCHTKYFFINIRIYIIENYNKNTI